MKKLVWFTLVVAIVAGGLSFTKNDSQPIQQVPPPPPLQKVQPAPNPATPTISVAIPNYLSYPQIISQLDKWSKEAPGLTEVGSYGSTSRKQSIHYIRLTNLLDPTPKKVVLITACIHGNEPLATGTLMSWVGTALSQYGKDKDVTDLLNTRDVYFVPVVSPDSYPNTRFVDGVDPNRNFPSPKNPNLKSVPPVKSVQDFFLKIKPSAAISTHTWGRACLIPWGDSMTNCPDYDSYKAVIEDQVCKLAHYRFMRACDMYGENGLNNPPPRGQEWGMPIYGGEMDWYYRNGALSMVMEVGTHQHIPSMQDIRTEFDMTYRAILLFIKEAPNVQLKQR